MRRMKRSRSVAAGLSISVATGCSWIGVTPPPESVSEREPLPCTESNAAPIADTTGAVLGAGVAVLGVGLLADAQAPCTDAFCGVGRSAEQGAGGIAIGAGVLFGALYLASSSYGFSNTSRCRELAASAGSPR